MGDSSRREPKELSVSVWDKSIAPEANSYNWLKDPLYFEPQGRKLSEGPTHIDLFSGCGGFSAGFEDAGFSTSLGIDIHPPSIETFRANHRNAGAILGDIRRIDSKQVERFTAGHKNLTVVTAGVPCQGFSLANRKRNAQDERNFLFREFVRIAKDLKPDAVVLENVSGLVSTADGGFKFAIANAIESLGFDVHIALLNAADYGVPQLRRRIFFVGVPRGQKWLFPFKTHGPSTPQSYLTVGEAILGDLPPLDVNESVNAYLSGPLTLYQKYLRKGSKELLNHESPNHPQSTIDRIRNTAPGEPMYKNFKQRIRLDAASPSPTQICGGIRPQFQFGHPTQSRGLSIRERARLQSFRDTYEFAGGITQGRVQTGNAVPPLLAKAIASQLLLSFNGGLKKGLAGTLIENELFA